MPKKYYVQLEKIFENLKGEVYVFEEDGIIVATNKRSSTEQILRCTVRSAKIIDKYPRGVAISEDGIKIMDESMSDGFLEVMKCIDAFNKEIYVSRNEKARRINPNRQQRKSDDSTN